MQIFPVDNYIVPRERIELSWGCPRTILSRLRLPIPPPRQQCLHILHKFFRKINFQNIFLYAKMNLCRIYIPTQFSGLTQTR